MKKLSAPQVYVLATIWQGDPVPMRLESSLKALQRSGFVDTSIPGRPRLLLPGLRRMEMAAGIRSQERDQ